MENLCHSNYSAYLTFIIFFMFIFPLADACFRESFPTSVANGSIVCTSGNISCTVTCDSGYIFNDGNKTKIYDCHSTNVWTPVLPVDSCISKYGHCKDISFILF